MAPEHDEGSSGPAAAPGPGASRSAAKTPRAGSAKASRSRANSPGTGMGEAASVMAGGAGTPQTSPPAATDPDPGVAMGMAEPLGGTGASHDGPHGAETLAAAAESAATKPAATKPAAKPSPKDALIEALMELAGERVWEDITLTDIAARANVSLADFRDSFPSKGAVLAGFSRKIDRIVLEGTDDDLLGEPAKERLFDVLMRRLDALAPYKHGLECVTEWLGRAPLAAAAVNRLEVNSMRFMLEAAGIDSEGPVGALKLQGLVIAWGRVLQVWLRDDDPALSKTMNALDKELTRGARIVGRADDINRLVSPLIALTKAMFERRPDYPRESGRAAEEPANF